MISIWFPPVFLEFLTNVIYNLKQIIIELQVILMTDKEYKYLRSSLSSTAMEGFPVTMQTEKDCIRLINGEISLDVIVQEILSRFPQSSSK